MTIFKILLGDITKTKFDAIVNAANTSLLGGGGVDGAIHRACGEELLQACKQLNGCSTGNAKITRSYNLNDIGIYWIIHTVGPIYRNNGTEEKYLRHAYRSALNIAANYDTYCLDQYNGILDNNLYRFNMNGLIGSKKKEHLIKEYDEYIQNHPIKTLAFPSISTGAYSYPLADACNIALDEILGFINDFPDALDEIAMICFDKKTFDMYETLYEKRNPQI